MTKKQLIENIVQLLLTEFEPYSVSVRDREFLEIATIEYLENKLKELQAEAVTKLRKQHADNIEQIEERVLRAQAERAVDFAMFQRSREPQRKAAETAQLGLDRQTFADAAKTLRSFAVNEANFNVIRQTIGSGFSVFAIQQALSSNALQLSPPTQQELDQWESERIEQHNEALQNLDPDQLRARVRQEASESRAAAVQQEADRQLAAATARDAVLGFPPLPTHWQGHQLDASFIRTCDVPTQKLLNKRFGPAQLEARLRGVA
jgi:hypothetical protein